MYPFRHYLLQYALGIYLELKMTWAILIRAFLDQIALALLVVAAAIILWIVLREIMELLAL